MGVFVWSFMREACCNFAKNKIIIFSEVTVNVRDQNCRTENLPPVMSRLWFKILSNLAIQLIFRISETISAIFDKIQDGGPTEVYTR